jgi:hypothetical protein
MKHFIWNLSSDIIFMTENYEALGPNDDYVSGIYYESPEGDKVILHSDDMTASFSIEYFVKLWNASFPDKQITLDNVSSQEVKTSAKKLYRVDEPITRLDYDLFPEYAKYMNSEGHIHPDADPDTLKKRNQLVGDLSELIFKHANIPGLSLVHDDDHLVHTNSPIDNLFHFDLGNGFGPQHFAAEIKGSSSHNQRPYRYLITGYGRKSSKTSADDKRAYISKLGKDYSPATVGVTMRYDDNMADLYMLPHQIGSFSRSTKGAVPLLENMPFDFNGFHPDPYHQSRAPERRVHGVDTGPLNYESPDPDEIFG